MIQLPPEHQWEERLNNNRERGFECTRCFAVCTIQFFIGEETELDYEPVACEKEP